MPSRRATISIDRLTLEQKVGQMFMLAFAGSTAASAATLLRDHHVGACYLSNDNLVDPAQSASLMADLQGPASMTPGSSRRPNISPGTATPASTRTAVWLAWMVIARRSRGGSWSPFGPLSTAVWTSS